MVNYGAGVVVGLSRGGGSFGCAGTAGLRVAASTLGRGPLTPASSLVFGRPPASSLVAGGLGAAGFVGDAAGSAGAVGFVGDAAG